VFRFLFVRLTISSFLFCLVLERVQCACARRCAQPVCARHHKSAVLDHPGDHDRATDLDRSVWRSLHANGAIVGQNVAWLHCVFVHCVAVGHAVASRSGARVRIQVRRATSAHRTRLNNNKLLLVVPPPPCVCDDLAFRSGSRARVFVREVRSRWSRFSVRLTAGVALFVTATPMRDKRSMGNHDEAVCGSRARKAKRAETKKK
jgi:hypothetical protein